MGGIALPQLLQAQGENRGRLGHKANIMVFLAGGPPHLDMFDMKPDAPEEIRGEFSPISTTVPGFQVCEHLPMLAARAHQYSVIRSLYGAVDRHDIYQCLTGRVFSPNQPVGGWPCLGSVVSKLKGHAQRGVPPFVTMTPRMKSGGWGRLGPSGFLGKAHAPFAPIADGADSLTLQGIQAGHFSGRARLLASLDSLKRQAEQISEFF